MAAESSTNTTVPASNQTMPFRLQGMVGSVEKIKIYFQLTGIFLAAMLFFCVSRAAHAQTCAVTVDKTVNICAPASGSTDNSPVQFTAAALDQEHPITGMIAYVDSVQKAQSGNASLSASVQLAAGTDHGGAEFDADGYCAKRHPGCGDRQYRHQHHHAVADRRHGSGDSVADDHLYGHGDRNQRSDSERHGDGHGHGRRKYRSGQPRALHAPGKSQLRYLLRHAESLSPDEQPECGRRWPRLRRGRYRRQTDHHQQSG